MKLKTVAYCSAAALVLIIFSVKEGVAQSYPIKPVRILVGFPPSGGNDVVARVVAI